MRIALREKRQITLPAELCEALGVRPGDSFQADIEDGALILTPSAKVILNALEEISRALRDAGVTEKELLESGKEVRKELFRETYPALARKYGI
jgi:bifunctional DNA-binding transcriptional regulator/antitoxin component of YhaV-PrlF toxin-antitoxin module